MNLRTSRFHRFIPWLLALALAVGVSGCKHKDKPTPTSSVTLSSIAVGPASPTTIVGGTVQLVATGSYSDGSSRDITATASWSSSVTGVATVAAGGLATGVSSGSSTITASQGSRSGTVALSIAGPMLAGTAAAGLPLVGNVTVKDSLGATKSVTLGANGDYVIDVGGMRPPLVLRAEGHVGDDEYVIHSAIATVGTGATVNITPLTDLIIDNVAGELARDYFDGGDFAGLTAAQLDAESAALKAKLLPVLLAMQVDASIDLLRTPFTPLASALDAALDVIRVSVDPALHLATITNLVNQVAINDDIAVPAADETDPPVLAGDGMSSTADDLVQIRQVFEDFSALYAQGLPAPAALLPLLSDGFRHDDQNRADFANDLAQAGDLVGSRFTDISIDRIDYDYGNGATPLATVSFRLLDSQGVQNDPGEHGFGVIREADGHWRLHGDQLLLSFDGHAFMVRDTLSSCRVSGLEFEIDDDDTSNSASVDYVLVKGPALPAVGLRYQRAGSDWRVVNGGNAAWYPMTSSCPGWGAAGLTDATIAAIPDDSHYTFEAYTALGAKVSQGLYGADFVAIVPRRPLTLAEVNASTRFPGFTTSVNLQTYGGGPITINGSGANAARPVWTYLGLTDGNGLLDSIDGDVAPAADGTFSKSYTLANPASVTAREVRVATEDDFGRSFMSLAYHVTGFSVGGSVGGLDGTVVLRLNGSNDLLINAPGPFTFGPTLANGTAYSVTVVRQPQGQVCGPGVANGTGTINGANVTNVALVCTNYSIGGPVSGLTGAGLVLRINGAGDLAVPAMATSFAIPASIPLIGIVYNVEVKTQPAGQTCTVVRPWGAVTASVPTVTDIGLACVDNVTDALSGTYRLTSRNGQAVTEFRAFLTLYPDGTYIFGVHEDAAECGATGHGGLEYGVYRWNQSTHDFEFVDAVIDGNGSCGVADDGVPGPVETLTSNADGTLTLVDPSEDGLSPPSVSILSPVPQVAGTLIGSFGTGQFFNVYGADGTLFTADVRFNPLVAATSPGIEDGCYQLSGTTTAGSYTVNVTNTCAVSATQTGADTNGTPWGSSQFGTGAWQFTITDDIGQFTIPGTSVSAPLPRIQPH